MFIIKIFPLHLLNFKINTQFKRNIISGSIVHGLNILVVMVSYPIYISMLGFQLFSVWALLSVVISFAKMGEFGISRAIIASVANVRAYNDILLIKRIFWASITIIAIPGVLIFCFLWFYNYTIISVLEIPNEQRLIAAIVVKYIGIAIITYMINDVLNGIISGLGRLDISNSILLFLNITKVIISVILLSNGFSILSLVYAIIIANTLTIFITIGYIIYGLNINILYFVIPNREIVLALVKFGASIMGIQVLNMFSVPFIKIILVRTVGVEAVGIFEIASKAGYSIRSLMEKGLFAIMPEIAFISGLKTSTVSFRNTVFQRVKTITYKLILFTLPFMLIFLLMAPLWLSWWLGSNYSKDILFVFWLLQPGIIVSLIALPSFYSLMAIKLERQCLIEALIRTIILILLSGVFLLFNLQFYYLFLFFGTSVAISNAYILLFFRNHFHKDLT
jgi:O-antigen/teichoic acid export membrane protein